MTDTARPRRGWVLAALSWLPDPVALLAAAWGAAALQDTPLAGDALAIAGFATLLAPFVLRDGHFGARVAARRHARLLQAHALRFVLLASVVLATAAVSGALDAASGAWLLAWAALAFVATGAVRAAVALALVALQRRGQLAEVVAIVGAGPVAERLREELGRAPPHTVQCLGVFDDRLGAARAAGAAGSLAQLVALGQARHIDWIVLTLPASAERRIGDLVQRLKALSTPIGLYSQQVGRDAVTWSPPIATAEAPACTFDDDDLEGFVARAAAHPPQRFDYVVTPNAGHRIHLQDDPAFQALSAGADHVMLDSRFIARLLRLVRGIELPVCTGSDLTARLLQDVVAADDTLVMVGGSSGQALALQRRYGLRALHHHNPPMGFIRDLAAVEECLRFVEAHSPFRFCFIALGSPQQEVLAQALRERGVARGLALCIGSALDFLTGEERRAPRWWRRRGRWRRPAARASRWRPTR